MAKKVHYSPSNIPIVGWVFIVRSPETPIKSTINFPMRSLQNPHNIPMKSP